MDPLPGGLTPAASLAGPVLWTGGMTLLRPLRVIPGRSAAEGRDEVPQKGIHSQVKFCKRHHGLPSPLRGGSPRKRSGGGGVTG